MPLRLPLPIQNPMRQNLRRGLTQNLRRKVRPPRRSLRRSLTRSRKQRNSRAKTETCGGGTRRPLCQPCGMAAKQVFYSGRVQGVGFRYTAKQLAAGFDVTGWVRNLPDGRVELLVIAEEAEELDA